MPPIDSNRLIKILERQGFKVIRQKGSHAILINEEKLE
ncbi:type II toxin-antitoxin system HicA family toxin [Candidatus Bathyarchaeota archaeon]|nr:type II toxin-antitoxin system HicA family toxin [Candidatus Bathyarchaeota archaeon]